MDSSTLRWSVRAPLLLEASARCSPGCSRASWVVHGLEVHLAGLNVHGGNCAAPRFFFFFFFFSGCGSVEGGEGRGGGVSGERVARGRGGADAAAGSARRRGGGGACIAADAPRAADRVSFARVKVTERRRRKKYAQLARGRRRRTRVAGSRERKPTEWGARARGGRRGCDRGARRVRRVDDRAGSRDPRASTRGRGWGGHARGWRRRRGRPGRASPTVRQMVASQWKMSSSALGPALQDVGGSF